MLLESVTGLVDSGYRVVVAVPTRGALVSEVEARGAQVRIVPMAVLRKAALRPSGMVRLLGRTARALLPNALLLREFRPDVVYVSTLTLPVWLVVARALGYPTVCHVHEADRHRSGLVSRALVLPLLLADDVIANSRYTRDALTELVPRLADRLVVAYNGVASPRSVVPPRPVLLGPARLLFVGRLAPRKGLHVAASAVRLLLQRGHPVELDVLGDAFPGYEWYEQEVIRDFADLLASGHLRLHGFTTDIWSHLAAADVVVVPSTLPESLGNTAIEALLGGRPAVVSGVGGLAEVAAQFPTVRVVPPGDDTALADAVAAMLDGWVAGRSAALVQVPLAVQRFAPDGYRRAVAALVGHRARAPRPTRRRAWPPVARRREGHH
jgi:glycosyltransferase involved in cell wall biosynthesis